jgi:hypothetical protein
MFNLCDQRSSVVAKNSMGSTLGWPTANDQRGYNFAEKFFAQNRKDHFQITASCYNFQFQKAFRISLRFILGWTTFSRSKKNSDRCRFSIAALT